MKKIILLTAFLMSLSACGGGGGGAAAVDEKPDPEPEVEIKDTKEITSNDEFEFKSSWEMGVDISIPQGANAMVSVCSGYTDKGDGTYDIDYATCSIQATLDDLGNLNNKMNVTNEVESLVGVVWFMDQSDPLYKNFTITNGQENLSWN